ncbi:MAG: TIGR02584 family CRISPR-associated protein, partial [Verrucomicrobia bacterium]|nr:TIGR02584 family CRISPR-associated protein [Verrucomicrobiota bacterium]
MPRRSRSQLRPPVPGPATCATVLIAVTGESPAVLTETVWALARENPPVLPARVIVVTTTVGAARLQAELLAPSPAFAGRSPWQALRDTLLAGRADADRLLALEDARVITGPAGPDGCARRLDDLRTRADNDAAADFILEQVRAITANADTRLV